MLSRAPPGFPVKELNRRVVPQGYQTGLYARIESERTVAFRSCTLQPRAASQGGDPSTGWNGSTSSGMCNACECQRQTRIRPGTAGRAQPVLPCRPGRRRKFGAEAGYTLLTRPRQAFSFFLINFPPIPVGFSPNHRAPLGKSTTPMVFRIILRSSMSDIFLM